MKRAKVEYAGSYIKAMVDGGAPHVSMAQAEFERMARHCQDEASKAAQLAAYYTEMAASLRTVYRRLIAESASG